MIFIGLGSNLSGRFSSPDVVIQKAVQELATRGLEITAASHVWQSSPVPASHQPDYKNAVIEVNTPLAPEQLMALLLETERSLGRARTGLRNEARVIDLDLLSYDDTVVKTPELHLPHPRMHERAFVLYPLQEIAPGWRHPVYNNTASELLDLLPPGQTIKRTHEHIDQAIAA